MKNLFLLSFILLQSINLSSQDPKPEIKGILSTGEVLTGVYPEGFFTFGNSFNWNTANDVTGTDTKEVGRNKTYKVKQEDAGRYIRFDVTTFGLIGKKETYYSNWSGPIQNGIPVILGNVTISGTLKVGNTLRANYVYDPDNYPESGSTFRWYLADNSSGSNAVLISSSGASLLLLPNHEPKYVRVEVTPRDINGSFGANYSSSWYGPIQKADPQINLPPVATNVRIRGNPVYCGVLTGLYDYTDSELDEEGASSFRWLRSSSTSGNPVPIPNETTNTYTVSPEDKDKYIYFEVTPKAGSGSPTGSAVISNPTSLIQGTLPSVTFAGNASICEGSTTVISLTFSGTPPFTLDYTNGTRNFSLSTSNYNYQLTVNSGGTYKGTKLTDILNCPVTNLPSSAVISLKPQPVLDFTVANACYTGDTTIFRNTSGSRSSIKNWSWNFGDNSAPAGQNSSSAESPKHKYPQAGNYTVRLSGENTEGCKDTISKTIQLGEKPVADISWDKECYASGLSTNFKSNSISTNKISKYNWSIRDATRIIKESTSSGFNYNIPAVGNYNVKLKITTESGCVDSVSKVFQTKPLFRLQDSSYSDNFEGSTKNWNIEVNSKNNWTWGDPTGQNISSPHSGSGAYYTSFPEKRQNQQLILTSPCFDFTTIQKPFIDIWINYATQESKEGAVLQYMQDGETDWETVGELNSGQNWYNNNSIAAQPGNQPAGWSGNSGGWKQARQSLQPLSNKNNMRLRIVYASAADATSADGFALDDVFIGQSAKKVLVEHFTNLSDAVSNQSNNAVDSVIAAAGLYAVGIQYHTSFPGADSLNEHNKANPAARALFYGIGKVPMSFLDGGWLPNYIYEFPTRKMSTNDINNRTFEDPKFDIKITSAILNNTMNGNVKVTALKNLSNNENTLYIAIVEDINVSSAGKTIVLKNVLKFMYPSSAGTLLPSNWIVNQTTDVSFSWSIAHVYNLSKLKAVAFIQNNQTKEVYQVEMALNSSITSAPGLNQNTSVLKVYPNPAKERVYVAFGDELPEDYHVQIMNPEGKLIEEFMITKGISTLELSVSNYPVGLYYIKIYNSNDTMKTGKIVVSR